MSIEKVYDGTAKHYNQDLSASVLNSANVTAQQFITIHAESINSILALGIGDGLYIEPYKKIFSNASIAGIDISSRMLTSAKERLDCDIYHGDIADTVTLTKGKTFDLALAHFVCAYVKPEVILKQAQSLLTKGGYLSVVTNTYQSFPKIMAAYEAYVSSNSWFANLLRTHIDSTFDTVFVPKNTSVLKEQFSHHGFMLVDEKQMTLEIEFEDAQAFTDFFMLGSWFASGLVHKFLSPKVVGFMFKKLSEKYLTFPFRDTMNIAIVLGQNK